MKKPQPQKPKQDDYVKTAFRLPPDLHAEVKESAEINGTSMNAEIIARLQMNKIEQKLAELTQQNDELKAMLRKILDKL